MTVHRLSTNATVIRVPPPPVPWQVTGNHWVCVPCIHPADASVHAVGLVSRAARGAVEFAGGADFTSGNAAPLLRPVVRHNGVRKELGAGGIAWERAFGWLPSFSAMVDGLQVRGTIFAPYGRDADVAGVVYALSIVNHDHATARLEVALEGTLGHRQQRVRSARPFDDAHRASKGVGDALILDGAALPAYAALGVASDADARLVISDGPECTWSLSRELTLASGERAELAFYIGAGPERDGAEATVGVMRRRGWQELLRATRATLQSFEQTTGAAALDRVLNRNLLFAYFCAVARALDDAHFYLVRTRVPWNTHGLTVRDWDALAWTIAAVQLADPDLARELILRMCELHGYTPGSGVHYLDGTLFEAGFNLEGAAAYAIAVDSYVAETGDDRIIEEPALAETLYQCWDDIESRRDGHVPLYSTEVTLSGAPANAYTAHGNAVVARALEVFKRTLDEKDAAQVEDPEAVRSALRDRFLGSVPPGAATTADDAGALQDDPVSSVLWLPFHGAVSRDDDHYRAALSQIHSSADAAGYLATRCAQLFGPGAREGLEWFRRAPLDNGFAAELVDPEGRAVANGGDASLAGLVALSLFHASTQLTGHW